MQVPDQNCINSITKRDTNRKNAHFLSCCSCADILKCCLSSLLLQNYDSRTTYILVLNVLIKKHIPYVTIYFCKYLHNSVYLFSFMILCVQKAPKSLCRSFAWRNKEDLNIVQSLREGSCRVGIKIAILEVIFVLDIDTLVAFNSDWGQRKEFWRKA